MCDRIVIVEELFLIELIIILVFKLRLALEKIAQIENVAVTDEDVEKEYAEMAENYKMELDKVKEYLGEAGKDSLKDDLAVQKAVDLIVDSAK